MKEWHIYARYTFPYRPVPYLTLHIASLSFLFRVAGRGGRLGVDMQDTWYLAVQSYFNYLPDHKGREKWSFRGIDPFSTGIVNAARMSCMHVHYGG